MIVVKEPNIAALAYFVSNVLIILKVSGKLFRPQLLIASFTIYRSSTSVVTLFQCVKESFSMYGRIH